MLEAGYTKLVVEIRPTETQVLVDIIVTSAAPVDMKTQPRPHDPHTDQMFLWLEKEAEGITGAPAGTAN